MSRQSKSLTIMCGGRFGIVPAAASDDPELENGPFRLLAIMCARARPDGKCRVDLNFVAKMLGVTVRVVQIWKRKLEKLGWIEELHEGDKAIGFYRVIRNPAGRPAVAKTNAAKIAERAARKTSHANRRSHPRCEPEFADNRKTHDPPSAPRGTNAADAGADGAVVNARQGNREASGPGAQRATTAALRDLNAPEPGNGPDWMGWADWVAASRKISAVDAWTWLMAEIDRIAEEEGIGKEEAGDRLDRRLKAERSRQR